MAQSLLGQARLGTSGRSLSVERVGRFSDTGESGCIVTLRLPPNLSGMSGRVSIMVDHQASKKEKEHRLIDSVLAGNHQDFHELIAPYRRGVYLTAYDVLQVEADAEDVAQENCRSVLLRVCVNGWKKNWQLQSRTNPLSRCAVGIARADVPRSTYFQS